MEPRLFDAHCHLDLMAHPDAVADEATALGLVLFDCGVDPHDFARAKSAPAAVQISLPASASIPGGSPTDDVATLKSICFAKSLHKNA